VVEHLTSQFCDIAHWQQARRWRIFSQSAKSLEDTSQHPLEKKSDSLRPRQN
jgi:hypothetical protein